MDKKVLTGIAAGLIVTATLTMVGLGAYRAGQRSDQTVQVIGEGSAPTLVVPRGGYDGWYGHGHGPGGGGFFLFPLLILGLVLFFAARRRGGCRAYGGPGGYAPRHRWDDADMQAWHAQEHAPVTPAGAATQPPQPMPPTAPPG